MKKAISLLLTLAMMLGIGAMLSVSAADAGLKAGFAQYDFTPTESVNMTGLAARNSEGLLAPEDRLMATVVAISDADNNTILMCTVDMLYPYHVVDVRKAISQATKVPEINIHISATHTHSAPNPFDSGYGEVYTDGFVDAAERAIADMSPISATKIASVEVPYLNQVRHCWRQNGHVNGNNFVTTSETPGAWGYNIYDPDREMQIIRFVRDDKKDVVMLNWQSHGTTASCLTDYAKAHKPYLSTDWIGWCRRYVEAQDTDTQVAVYVGAAADVNSYHQSSKIREQTKDVSPEDTTVLGARLGDHVLTAMKNMKTVNTNGPVKSMEIFHKTPDVTNTAISEVRLTAASIGSVIGFASAPYEMYTNLGKYIKANSPFEMTFVLSNCNGNNSYVPVMYAYDYPELFEGNPVAYGVTSTKFAAGSGEDFSYSLVGMLNVLYKG